MKMDCRPTWRCLTAVLSVCWLGSFSISQASAQTNSLFGSSGPLSGSNGFSTGSTAMQGTGMFGSGGSSGAGGMGAGAMGGTGAAGGAGGMAAGAQAGAPNTAQRRSTFVGNANAANAANGRFVGSAQAGSGQQQQRGRNQLNQMNTQGRRGATNRRGGAQDNTGFGQTQGAGGAAGPQRIIRPQQRVAFEFKAPSSTKTEAVLSKRFENLSKRAAFQGVSIATEGSTVTLQGEVNSAETKRLAAMLAGLEPGVRKVNNELTIKGKAPSLNAPEPQ